MFLFFLLFIIYTKSWMFSSVKLVFPAALLQKPEILKRNHICKKVIGKLIMLTNVRLIIFEIFTKKITLVSAKNLYTTEYF